MTYAPESLCLIRHCHGKRQSSAHLSKTNIKAIPAVMVNRTNYWCGDWRQFGCLERRDTEYPSNTKQKSHPLGARDVWSWWLRKESYRMVFVFMHHLLKAKTRCIGVAYEMKRRYNCSVQLTAQTMDFDLTSRPLLQKKNLFNEKDV